MTYEITLEETTFHRVTVDAEHEEAAKQLALAGFKDGTVFDSEPELDRLEVIYCGKA